MSPPEVGFSDEARAHAAGGNPNAGFSLEARLRRLYDHESHPYGVKVVVLVGTSWRAEGEEQNQSLLIHDHLRKRC